LNRFGLPRIRLCRLKRFGEEAVHRFLVGSYAGGYEEGLTEKKLSTYQPEAHRQLGRWANGEEP
jgi:hypothetical protein